MANVPLKEYIKQIEDLLHSDGYERAIALCQHGLRTYPRCTEFYRLLGQACLETERPDDAADMFRRVLGADPENFVAHVGLGVVADGIGALEEAIWQLERALEVEPNHVEVRQELQRLLARRDGQSPTRRLKLTRTALGHVYLKGEQYDRAAIEFRTVLSMLSRNGEGGAQDRFDLQVALAEALYRGGHQREAAELCQQVLKILPNALKPNLILGDIYLETGREDEAHPLFDRAQSLDPENRLAQQILNQPAPLLPRTVTMEMPSAEALFPPTTPAPTQPSLKEAETALPWLGHAPTPPPFKVLETPPPAPTEAEEAAPEWLRELRTQSRVESPQTPAVETPSEDATPDWLRSLRATSPVAPVGTTADEPAWLKDLGVSTKPEPSTMEAPVQPETPLDRPAMEQTADVDQAGLPDWLRTVREPSAETPPPSIIAETAPAEDVPDWLKALGVKEIATPAAESAAEASAPQKADAAMPAWLAELRQAEAPTTESESAAPTELASREEPQAQQLSTAATEFIVVEEVSAPESATAEIESPVPPTLDTTTPEPPRAPREATAYFDDSSAPPSIETQVAPTGAAEQQARLELARAMKDMDVDEALDLYALMGDASPSLRQQAIDDLTTLAQSNTRAQSILEQLQASAPSESAPSVPRWLAELQTPASPEAALGESAITEDTVEQLLPFAEAAAPALPIVAEETFESAPPTAEAEVEAKTPTVPVVDETVAIEPARTPREATAYFDDSTAPPSIETQAAPTGEAEYKARLDLARLMKDVDLDSALDQYALMRGAREALLEQAIADVMELTRTHAHHPRTHVVLEQLQGSAAAEPEQTQAVADLQQMAPAIAEVHEPAEPIVAEETMTQAQAVTEPEAESPTLPVVDETLATEPPKARVPREAAAFLDDSTAPPSVESQVAPTGMAEYQARLDLARALKFMDVDEALDLYAQMGGANTALRQQAMNDLEQLAKKSPRAQVILEQLRGIRPGGTAPLVQPPQPIAEEKSAEPIPPKAEEKIAAEPAQPRAPREATAYFDDSAAPPSIETQVAPTGEAEHQARLELARTLKDIDLHESADQYQSLIEANTPLLAQVIDDLAQIVHDRPTERGVRVLLADALTRAGRLQEAIEQYRQLV